MTIRTFLTVALLGGCTFEAHCGTGQDTIKQNEAESGTADALRKQGANPTAVHCDTAGVAPEVGKQFVCHVELDGKKTYDFRATITSRTGDHFQYDIASVAPRAVIAAKLESSLATTLDKELGVDVTIDCHEPLPSVPADGVLPCDATAGGFTHPIEIHLDDTLTAQNVTYGGLVSKKSLEDAFLQANPTATIDCGKDPLVTAEGLPCHANGEHGPATITMHVSADRKISWTQN